MMETFVIDRIDEADENNNQIEMLNKRKYSEEDSVQQQVNEVIEMKRVANASTMDLRSHCEEGCCLAGPGLTALHHMHQHKRAKTMTPPPMSKRQVNETTSKLVHNSTKISLQGVTTSAKSSTTSSTVKETITKTGAEITTSIVEQDYNHNNFSSTLKKKRRNTSKSPVRSSSTITDHRHYKSERTIHNRYQEYLNLSQEERDRSKTDYTYAHSYSYSPFVLKKERYCWLVPNMSRSSVSHYSSKTFLDKNAVSKKINLNFNSNSSLNRSTVLVASELDETMTTASSSRQTTKVMRNNGTLRHRIDESEHIMHSTPIKSVYGSSALKSFEYSDDDDEDAQILQQVQQQHVRNGVKSRAKNGVRTANSAVNAPNNFSPDDAQLSEEEEDITIIRRINRYVFTTVRNFFLPLKEVPEEELFQSSSTHRRSIRRSSEASDSSRRQCLFWSLLFLLLPILFSSGAYLYWFNGRNLGNLLEDFSTSSSARFTTLWDRFGFASERLSSSNGNYQDLAQFNFEIKSLRSEIELMKSKYQADGSLSGGSTANTESLPPQPPDGPNFDEILDRLAMLELRLTSCCQNFTANLTETIESEVKHVLDSKMYDFQAQYDKQLELEIDKVKTALISLVREQAANYTIGRPNGSINPTDIEAMIKTAISKYDADKTGEADFALESSGAWVVSTRCSETYELFSASYKLLGVTLWRSRNTPRVVIQSGVIPGECWCFKGAEGRIAIHLSSRIIPSAFSYEHIPVALSRDGHIHSAPSKFAVYGLKAEDDIEPEQLGEYRYVIDGDVALQRFEVQNQQTALHTFKYIELVVKSNHGHPEYTCLYRFRVHGTPVFDENQ